MKPLLLLAVILILGGLLQLWLPFWVLPAVAFAAAFWLRPQQWVAFAAGLMAGLLLWGGYAYYIHAANEGILAARIGGMLNGQPAWVPLLLTAVLGGLLAGTGAFSGALCRVLLVAK